MIDTSPSAAIPFYKRAIELDPNFAMAYANLGIMYGDLLTRTWSIGGKCQQSL